MGEVRTDASCPPPSPSAALLGPSVSLLLKLGPLLPPGGRSLALQTRYILPLTFPKLRCGTISSPLPKDHHILQPRLRVQVCGGLPQAQW